MREESTVQDPVIRMIGTRNVITRTNLPVGDYAANPYVGCTHGCIYCYARFMKRFTDHHEPWGAFLDVKQWEPVRSPGRYDGKGIFLGSVTDPYLPEERRFRRTRALLEELKGSGIRLSIQTKSDLVLRDLDLIQSYPDARVGFSINTLDEDFRQDMDNAATIERRLKAMETLHDAGIRTTCFISPIFPGITDAESIMERVRNHCNLIWLENLNLRDGSCRAAVMEYIRGKHPDLIPLYEDIYLHGSRAYWEEEDRKIREYAAGRGLYYVRNDDTSRRSFEAPPLIVNYFFHEEVRKTGRKGSNA